MRRNVLYVMLMLISFSSQAQLGVTIQGGYSFPNGEHHSDFASKLLDKANYDSSKKFMYTTALKLDYTLKHVTFGVGYEIGNYQTKKETSIIGLSSFLSTKSFVAISGQYKMPYAYVQYATDIIDRITIRAGVMAGAFIADSSKSNGVLDITTDPILGIIPSQNIGAVAKAGKSGDLNSSALAIGLQMEVGVNLNKNFNVNVEWASRKTSMDASATAFTINQPLHYNLWLNSVRLGIRYNIHFISKSVANTINIE